MSGAHRRAAARDKNEPAIIAAFEGRFWRVVRHVVYDLAVCCPRCKNQLSIEVKMPQDEKKATPALEQSQGGRLTPSQQKLLDAGWPLLIARTVEDVARIVHVHDVDCRRLALFKRADRFSE